MISGIRQIEIPLRLRQARKKTNSLLCSQLARSVLCEWWFLLMIWKREHSSRPQPRQGYLVGS
jgi:hypothetical protein